MNNKTGRTPCTTCGGTGQIAFFQGKSRFLLTMEECPACFGLGYLLPEEDEKKPHRKPSTKNKGRRNR